MAPLPHLWKFRFCCSEWKQKSPMGPLSKCIWTENLSDCCLMAVLSEHTWLSGERAGQLPLALCPTLTLIWPCLEDSGWSPSGWYAEQLAQREALERGWGSPQGQAQSRPPPSTILSSCVVVPRMLDLLLTRGKVCLTASGFTSRTFRWAVRSAGGWGRMNHEVKTEIVVEAQWAWPPLDAKGTGEIGPVYSSVAGILDFRVGQTQSQSLCLSLAESFKFSEPLFLD